MWSAALLAELLAEARKAGWAQSASSEAKAAQPAIAASRLHAALQERLAASSIDVRVAPMEWLQLRLALSPVVLDALWVLACLELDPALARLAQVFGVAECPDLSVQIWQRLVSVSEDEIERIAELGLIETATDVRLPMHRRWVRAADRVIELARGELRLDPEVASICALTPPNRVNLPRARIDLPSAEALLVATGVEGAGRATLLRDAASARGLGVLEVRVAELASDAEKLRRQLRAVVREARLFGIVPLLRDLDAAKDVRSELIQSVLLAKHEGLVMATASDSPAWVTTRPVVVMAAGPLTSAERANLWESVLPNAATDVITEVSERYTISPGAIVAAARNANARVSMGGVLSVAHVHEGLRAHLGQKLGALAKRIEWRQTWDDLVLPEAQREQVDELIARVRHRRQVLEVQGFGGKTAKGHGQIALLSGEPGTGKTMVAGLIAVELGLDLYQVDLSNVVSKYIGETEKGLARLFDAAESGHIVLLFDEADALFAKRSEVKSSNDRYANLETNYLLQRLESFAGISILTTNHDAALDDAFRRRLACHIKFPLPDEAERAKLWRALIPRQARVARDINLGRLAQDFDMSGGHIKNAVMRAAYLAAAHDAPISMEYLRKAAHAEYDAMGRISNPSSRL